MRLDLRILRSQLRHRRDLRITEQLNQAYPNAPTAEERQFGRKFHAKR